MKHNHSELRSRNVLRQPNLPRIREDVPRMTQNKDGVMIWCPFCVPSHPLTPGQPAPCGTQLKLTAVQTVIPARVARLQKIVCLKCHQSGEGEMVQYMNGFIHLKDCAPDTSLLRTPPNYHPLAGLVFKLPKKLRAQVSRLTGYPQQVREIDAAGKETGQIVGYFFLKGQANATRATAKPTA